MATQPRNLRELVTDKYVYKLFSLVRKRASDEKVFNGIVVPVDDLIGHHIMATGRFESTQFDGLAKVLEAPELAARAKSGRFVDVGANIGLYSIAFSDQFASTLAVEANPQTFLILKANLALRSKDSVTPICLGASNTSADTEIHVPLNGNLGWATLNATHHSVTTKAIPVSITVLHDILREHAGPPAAVLKIDVEGHEQNVLEGAAKTLRNAGPVVLFEVLTVEVGNRCAELLQDCGYQYFYTFERGWPVGGNMLARMWRGFRSGLPVLLKAIDSAGLHKAALVCASKSPLA